MTTEPCCRVDEAVDVALEGLDRAALILVDDDPEWRARMIRIRVFLADRASRRSLSLVVDRSVPLGSEARRRALRSV